MKSNNINKIMILLAITISFIFLTGCAQHNSISGKFIRIEYNQLMHSRVIAKFSNSKDIMSDFMPSEFIIIDSVSIKDFIIDNSISEYISENGLSGKRLKLSGQSNHENIRIYKELIITIYEDYSDMAFVQVNYKNTGANDLHINGWVNNLYNITADTSYTPAFWSYQSGSYESRPDWILPLSPGFKQENYMGMNASDYGGGTPVIDVWRKDVGIGVGHIEKTPKLVSLPVDYKDKENGVNLRVMYHKNTILKPGDSLKTMKTFVTVHKGDYYNTLSQYSHFMQKIGVVEFKPFPETAYEPIWCAWGYERKFNTKEVLATLPKVRELGYKWAVLDDGWQTAEGDWFLNRKKFPCGDMDMKAFVDRIQANDLKAKLWWAPLAVDPGTELIKNNADLLLLNEDGSTQLITWWDSYYLCPAYKGTIEYTKNLVEKIMSEWGYEGLKIDGQHLNGAPPCFNPVHNHNYPEESVEAVPEFFKIIYETALSINSEAVVEICPCGTAYAFHTMPFMNQPVSSDPMSSWQIRLKGKTLKALMGPNTPYYGDHVELSDEGSDFASTVGVGGVVGTKFTWPTDRLEHKNYLLTKEKEAKWKKWNQVYLDHMLPKAKYLGELYDIGFDKPETHVIKKDNSMYYAFYADKFDGIISFKGLPESNIQYRVFNYITNEEVGKINGNDPQMEIRFDKYLLVLVNKI